VPLLLASRDYPRRLYLSRTISDLPSGGGELCRDICVVDVVSVEYGKARVSKGLPELTLDKLKPEL
jgi:hypothetical protein